jgi:predicted extracellular nuclease
LNAGSTDLIITGVIDGPLSGGIPKAIEIYALNDVTDLSVYGIGSANNGGGSDGEEFTLSGSATQGSFLYVASEAVGFQAFFGFPPTFTSFAASINGDDAIELFKSGVVVDTFGDINTGGTGQQPWEYLDGWAYRVCESAAAGAFDIAQWTFSGRNALDGESSNAAAETPFPIGSFCDPTQPTVAPTSTPLSVKIHDVQGDGSSSPLANVLVEVEAIVVGDFQNGDDDEGRSLFGFFIQEEDSDVDDNVATSEGVFVFDGFSNFGDVKLGDKVIVVGEPSERFGQTQINAEAVTVVSSGNSLPTPASIMLDPTGATSTNLEPYEGMLVVFDQKLTLVEQFQLQRFSEVRFAAGERPVQFTQTNDPNVTEFEIFEQELSNRLIILDDGLDGQNNVCNKSMVFLFCGK